MGTSVTTTAQDLIHEFACIFSQDDLDLRKTSTLKHSIKVTDPVPFKEQYRHIPPGMYDEVKSTHPRNVGCGCH